MNEIKITFELNKNFLQESSFCACQNCIARTGKKESSQYFCHRCIKGVKCK